MIDFFCKGIAASNVCDERKSALRHLKISWVKAYKMSCWLIFTSMYPLTRLIGLAVEMYRIKGLLNFLETHTFLIQQKITEGRFVCK